MTTEEILSRLSGVNPNGSGKWTALCPAHLDTHPSLSVATGDNGKPLLYCFSGCTYDAILAAIGAGRGEASANGRKKPAVGFGRIVATYDYRDTNGRLIHQTVRCSPKAFRQRRPDQTQPGGWAWSLSGVTPILYRLREVTEEVAAGRTVCVVEGEKDADNLAATGLCATTNPMGAGKWRSHYSGTLRDADVIILPDNDVPGREHAEHVAASLRGIARRIRVLALPDLPEHGDVSDWLAAGGTREDLERLAGDCPDRSQREATMTATVGGMDHRLGVVRLADVEPEEVRYLWRPYLPIGRVTILEGDPGIGKSYITLALAAAVTEGDGFPDFTKTDPGNVLVMSAEDGIADTIRSRFDAMLGNAARMFLVDPVEEIGEPYLSPLGLELLERRIDAFSPLLVIIDPLVAYLDPRVDMHRANEVRPIMRGLTAIAKRRGVAALVVRHLTKSRGKSAAYCGIGSIDFTAASRSVLLAGKTADGKRAIVHTKSNGPEGGSVGYEIDDDGMFAWTGASTVTSESILSGEGDLEERSRLEEAREFLTERLAGGQARVTTIRAEARQQGITLRTLERAKSALHVDSRKNGDIWFWTLTGGERR